MADPNGPPRRVSMSYILGFSKTPFKDSMPQAPPRPRQPSGLTQMATTPGGIVEWTASDGRKGKLTGTGKQRLTAAALAKVPSETRSRKSGSGAMGNLKSASNKPVSEVGPFGDLFAAADAGNKDVSRDAKGGWNKMDTDDNPHGFTDEDDKKMLEWKSNNANKPWTTFAAEIGKTPDQCKERFKQIKPKDWKPNNAKGTAGGAGGAGGGGDQKQSKKDKKQNQDWNQGQGNKKNDEAPSGDALFASWGGNDASVTAGDNKKDSTTKVDEWTGVNAAWDQPGNTGDNNKESTTKGNEWNSANPAWDQPGSTGGKSRSSKKGSVKGENNPEANNGWFANTANGDGWGNDGANDNSGAGAVISWDETRNNTGNHTGGGGAAAPAWEPQANNGDAALGAWNLDNNQNNNISFDANDTWNNPAPAKAASKANSKAGNQKPGANSHNVPQNSSHSNNAQTATAAPVEIEIKPDDMFSTDDLRLIARILQQDASMVWNRLSWRFRDKTGRTLHPDIFERKITGNVEGKNSEMDSRRGR